MKKIFALLALLIAAIAGHAQLYDPSIPITFNKPVGMAQGWPTDARSWFYDAGNFKWRPYQDTTEVNNFLYLTKYRAGAFIIEVDSGGTLNPDGTYSNFHSTYWIYKDGTARSNLTKLQWFNPPNAAGTITSIVGVNQTGITWLIGNPTGPSTSIAVQLDAGSTVGAAGDVSGTWPSLFVNTFGGQPPSFYLNYNNLTNTPTIPLPPNFLAGAGINITGSYPNLTISSTITQGFTTAGVYLVSSGGGNTINLDTAHYRKQDSMWSINDSTIGFSINLHNYSITTRGGVHGSGSGAGTVFSVSGVNANGINWSITNPTSNVGLTISLTNITPTTVNGLTLATIANGFTITGGTGTPRTLTVNAGNANVSGTNTGDITLVTNGFTNLSLAGQVLTNNGINLGVDVQPGTLLPGTSFPALSGDVTNSAGSPVITIVNSAVTLAKMANITGPALIGRWTGTGVPQLVTLGAGLSLDPGTGILTSTGSGSVTSIGITSADLSVAGSPVTSSGNITLNINNNAVTNAKLAQMAALTIKGNNTGVTANPIDLTGAQVTAMLSVFTTTTKGLVPASGSASGTLFLANDGTFRAPSSNPYTAGFGLKLTGTVFSLDTTSLKDTTHIRNLGPGSYDSIAYVINPQLLGFRKFQFGAGFTVVHNADSSIALSVAATGGTPTLQQVLTAGSTLTQNNTIAGQTFITTITGSAAGSVLTVTNTGTGVGLLVNGGAGASAGRFFATSGGIGVYGQTDNGSGVQGVATGAGQGVYGQVSGSGGTAYLAIAADGSTVFNGRVDGASTNTVITAAVLNRNTTGTAANGIGGSLDLQATTNNGSTRTASSLIWKWTTAADATRNSEVDITTVNAGVTGTTVAITPFGTTFTASGSSTAITASGSTVGGNLTGSTTGGVISGGVVGMQVLNTSTSTNTVVQGIVMIRSGVYTGAAGNGISLEYDAKNNGGSQVDAVELRGKLAGVTAGAENGELDILLTRNGAAPATLIQIGVNATNIIGTRFAMGEGANVSSANNLTLGTDGNTFHITGAVQINAITTQDWQAGSVFRLIFDSNPVVKNNTAGGGGTAVIRLAGNVDFTAQARAVLTLVFDGTNFYEASRSLD